MRHLSAPFDRAHARRSTADVTKPTYEEGVMTHPTPPLHGAPALGKRATSNQAALTPRRRRLAVRRAAKLRERYLPARLALAQDSPHDGKASADYVRTLDELWDIERRLEDAPASVDEPISSTVQPGHLVTVEFKGRRRLLWRRGRPLVAQYRLVRPVEGLLDEATVSVESPLAQAVLGRTVGARVQVDAAAGRYFVRILATVAVPGEL
jgi:transcription elongation GreA/GreB family factor